MENTTYLENLLNTLKNAEPLGIGTITAWFPEKGYGFVLFRGKSHFMHIYALKCGNPAKGGKEIFARKEDLTGEQVYVYSTEADEKGRTAITHAASVGRYQSHLEDLEGSIAFALTEQKKKDLPNLIRAHFRAHMDMVFAWFAKHGTEEALTIDDFEYRCHQISRSSKANTVNNRRCLEVVEVENITIRCASTTITEGIIIEHTKPFREIKKKTYPLFPNTNHSIWEMDCSYENEIGYTPIPKDLADTILAQIKAQVYKHYENADERSTRFKDLVAKYLISGRKGKPVGAPWDINVMPDLIEIADREVTEDLRPDQNEYCGWGFED